MARGGAKFRVMLQALMPPLQLCRALAIAREQCFRHGLAHWCHRAALLAWLAALVVLDAGCTSSSHDVARLPSNRASTTMASKTSLPATEAETKANLHKSTSDLVDNEDDAEPAAPSSRPKSRAATEHEFRAAMPPVQLRPDSPAMRYANMAPADCRAEIVRRKLPLKRDCRPTPGVATAVRFTGPVHDVTILAGGWSTPYGVFDCRLALAFEEMAKVLSEHGVVQVNVGTVYRPEKRRQKKLSQHGHGLAADIVGFKLEDGRTLVIERDLHGQIGETPSGPDSPKSFETEDAVTLRNLVCEVRRQSIFHYMLTPNYDQAHHDHLHVDVMRNARRGVIR
jgi:hypothetical protein